MKNGVGNNVGKGVGTVAGSHTPSMHRFPLAHPKMTSGVKEQSGSVAPHSQSQPSRVSKKAGEQVQVGGTAGGGTGVFDGADWPFKQI